MGVVLGDGQQPLPRHVLAADDVFQEWHDVVRPFRSAEGNQEHGVIRRGRTRIIE